MYRVFAAAKQKAIFTQSLKVAKKANHQSVNNQINLKTTIYFLAKLAKPAKKGYIPVF